MTSIYNTDTLVSGWFEEEGEEVEGGCLYIGEVGRMALCSKSFTARSPEFNSFVKRFC